MLSSSCHKKSVSPFVASMLVSVLNSNLSYYPFLNTQMGLRQLISRRFQAFYMNYNHFLEGLLEFGSQYIGKENFCEILKKRVKNNKTKRHVVDEIIKTEEAYLNGLETLLVWKTTAVAQEMISDEDASNMFSNVDVLCGINTKFLNDLR